MIKFKQRFNKLKEENELSVESIQQYLNLNSSSLIYFWLDGTYTPKLKYLNKLANLFECSIDYLVGKTDNIFANNKVCVNLPCFSERLTQIIKDKGLTKSILRKQNIIGGSLHRSIFERKSDPTIETLIKLADYLNVSIDYLVGRE